MVLVSIKVVVKGLVSVVSVVVVILTSYLVTVMVFALGVTFTVERVVWVMVLGDCIRVLVLRDVGTILRDLVPIFVRHDVFVFVVVDSP